MEKIGVFLCTGCGIGEAIDVDEVIEAADEVGCACTLTHECLCKRARRHPGRRLLRARQDPGVCGPDRGWTVHVSDRGARALRLAAQGC